LPITRQNVEFNDLPIWRDNSADFVPIEQLFGQITGGCCFGELSLLNLNED